MSLAEEYNEILGNRIYMPHRMQYSLLEFANKIVNRISQEYRMLYPDESLISLLRNAAWLGCEYIKLLDSTKTSETVINPEVITAIKEHINLVTSKRRK